MSVPILGFNMLSTAPDTDNPSALQIFRLPLAAGGLGGFIAGVWDTPGQWIARSVGLL